MLLFLRVVIGLLLFQVLLGPDKSNYYPFSLCGYLLKCCTTTKERSANLDRQLSWILCVNSLNDSFGCVFDIKGVYFLLLHTSPPPYLFGLCVCGCDSLCLLGPFRALAIDNIDAWTKRCCIHPRTLSCVTTPDLSTTRLSSDAARTTTCATVTWKPSCTSATPQVKKKRNKNTTANQQTTIVPFCLGYLSFNWTCV